MAEVAYLDINHMTDYNFCNNMCKYKEERLWYFH